jgi:hypothetical protein
MSDEQDSLKDRQISRAKFLKLVGAGSMFLGLSAFGISNFLKTFSIREASAVNETGNKIISNDVSSLNMSDIRPFQMNVPEAELVELRREIS